MRRTRLLLLHFLALSLLPSLLHADEHTHVVSIILHRVRGEKCLFYPSANGGSSVRVWHSKAKRRVDRSALHHLSLYLFLSFSIYIYDLHSVTSGDLYDTGNTRRVSALLLLSRFDDAGEFRINIAA